MNKLDMAHEMAIKIAENGLSIDVCIDLGWKYADAMKAEADKREPKGFPDVFLTKKPNGECAHIHTTFNRTECFDCGQNLKQDDWQPDWSVEVKADAWRMYGDGSCAWLIDIGNNEFKWYQSAPSFNYQGNWKQSLRKRPQ